MTADLSPENRERLAVKLTGVLAWKPGPNQTLDVYAQTVADYVAPEVARIRDEAVRQERERIRAVLPEPLNLARSAVCVFNCDDDADPEHSDACRAVDAALTDLADAEARVQRVVEAVEAVYEQHVREPYVCTCGWPGGVEWVSAANHAEHVEVLVRAALQAAQTPQEDP